MIFQSLIYFFVSIIILAVIFMMGPRLNMDVQLSKVNLPLDLDVYLSEKESLFVDIKQNTEKTIYWFDNDIKKPTKISFVYIHGFSSSRQEISPVLENMAKKLSANVYFTRLTGCRGF